jgi:DNA-binding response OmpR family regulator
VRILIAEDDLHCHSLLTAVLEKYGHEVVPTRDGAAAWAELQRPDAPRLAILDRMMPGLDGLEVCRKVRALPTDRQPYILMLTALGEKEHVAEGLDAGANDYLGKPFSPLELRARIAAGERSVAVLDRATTRSDELRTALAQVKTIRGIVSICCHCNKIRENANDWTKVEAYVAKHTEAKFSHGMCPDCLDKHYPDEGSAATG